MKQNIFKKLIPITGRHFAVRKTGLLKGLKLAPSKVKLKRLGLFKGLKV